MTELDLNRWVKSVSKVIYTKDSAITAVLFVVVVFNKENKQEIDNLKVALYITP